VEPRSPADKAGVKPNDRLVSINGSEINDRLDYGFYLPETAATFTICREEKIYSVRLTPKNGEVGLGFSTYLMSEKSRCKNNCIFCFIDQLPKNCRETLYFKDDDARLSFLQGNYITLTNLSDSDIERIIKMRLPVNVSVHTTEPLLREQMLRNKNAGKSLDYLYRLAKAGNSLNLQIVLCPDINDKIHLDKTLADLTSLGDCVKSIAVVPVGLTKHREGLCQLRSFTEEEAAFVINQCDKHKRAHAADEFYLTAKREFPPYDDYDGFPQYENGVGIWRACHDDFLDEKQSEFDQTPRSVATGTAAAPLLRELLRGSNTTVYAIRNDFFGETVTCAGLIVGGDILAQLEGKPLGSELLIPSTMLKADEDVFLDDMTLDELSRGLGVRVKAVTPTGADLVQSVCLDYSRLNSKR
jgi:putative radical SAM enzyme (TIGR03279 family)